VKIVIDAHRHRSSQTNQIRCYQLQAYVLIAEMRIFPDIHPQFTVVLRYGAVRVI